MHGIYRQLCDDHKHMQRLLDVFEALLDELGRQDRDPATLSMILDALDYFSVYPDQWHHPVEDLVFGRLLDKPVDIRDVLGEITVEHKAIAAATRNMNQLFYAVANDAAVEREHLFATAREYIALQRAHMKKENEILLPLVAQHLTDTDWGEIADELMEKQSSHFHRGVKRLYEAIYQDLSETALAEAC
ncbi:hemerythrin domain-containing protein [Microbulbifer hydrolyticus]|uniref:Hemerythrin HHE cation-binding protein n=1 Tax=Microbulbifer hydrolyticus TaxID=48074 RepID=A0A6P1T955_9GAMM|nr:hemerythrin domain-containing protein [Microbulbifer hydrolyticus]MBB5211047.1 hemerythrin-like domain-containing protein [Microbulbifer hydrolyticus]QHQ38153.1 hemerythrin HHE cation-binding protein [Microbulbifer hydrolyticus]